MRGGVSSRAPARIRPNARAAPPGHRPRPLDETPAATPSTRLDLRGSSRSEPPAAHGLEVGDQGLAAVVAHRARAAGGRRGGATASRRLGARPAHARRRLGRPTQHAHLVGEPLRVRRARSRRTGHQVAMPPMHDAQPLGLVAHDQLDPTHRAGRTGRLGRRTRDQAARLVAIVGHTYLYCRSARGRCPSRAKRSVDARRGAVSYMCDLRAIRERATSGVATVSRRCRGARRAGQRWR